MSKTKYNNSDTNPNLKLTKGELGNELIVLSKSDVRIIRIAEATGEICKTMDGEVTAQKGDFIVKTFTGEEYPVKPPVFFGSYEILAKVGKQIVGRRLIHERRAWPVISEIGAELSYGSDRGTVFVQKGGWMYQTKEEDFGLINKDVNDSYHTMIGDAGFITGVDWIAKFRSGLTKIAILTPILSLLALISFALNISGRPDLATITLILEFLLLVLGLAHVWWMKKFKWRLKAALLGGRKILQEFQIAAEILGFPKSSRFAGAALWRAAQSDEPMEADLSPELIDKLKDQVSTQIENADRIITQDQKTERIATFVMWFSALAILFCVTIAAITHNLLFEAFAIWLPSLVGFALTTVWRRDSISSISASLQLKSQLVFARKELGNWTNSSAEFRAMTEQQVNLKTLIRMLCHAAASNSQLQISEALSHKAEPPV